MKKFKDKSGRLKKTILLNVDFLIEKAVREFLLFFALFLIFFNFILPIISQREKFAAFYDPLYWQKRYEQSQWAKGLEAKVAMGDPELYSYAGWRQVQGDDPANINAEQPPLGKYLIGLSILLFENQYWVSVIFGAVILWLVFLISRQFLPDNLWPILPVFIFSFEKLFQDDLTDSMLDLPMTLFFLAAIYLLTKFWDKKGKKERIFLILGVISLTAVSLTKMYLAGFFLTAVIAIYHLAFFQKNKRKVFHFFLFLIAFPIFYSLTYVVYFLKGHNLADFKYLHFWIRHFARVQVPNYPKGEIFKILFLGRWQTWWGESAVVKVLQWRIFWPLALILTVWAFFDWFKRREYGIGLLVFSSLAFIMMYFFGVPYPRYLLPILPGIYIVATYQVFMIWGKIKRPKKQ